MGMLLVSLLWYSSPLSPARFCNRSANLVTAFSSNFFRDGGPILTYLMGLCMSCTSFRVRKELSLPTWKGRCSPKDVARRSQWSYCPDDTKRKTIEQSSSFIVKKETAIFRESTTQALSLTIDTISEMTRFVRVSNHWENYFGQDWVFCIIETLLVWLNGPAESEEKKNTIYTIWHATHNAIPANRLIESSL